MKIAHLIPYFFSTIGGLQVCVHNIARHHAAQGHDVHVFHCDAMPRSSITPYTCTKIPNFRATRKYPFRKRLITGMIARLQKQYQFDLWQINGGYPYGVLLADYFNMCRIPSVLRCSGDDIQVNWELDYGVRRDPAIDRAIIKNYSKFSALVAITETVRHEYRKIGVPDKQIFRIPNGVDIKRIKKMSIAQQKKFREQLSSKHNISTAAKIILTIGRNHPKKGYSLIPGMLKSLLEAGIDAYWIIIGQGSSQIGRDDNSRAVQNRLILLEEINSDDKSDLPPDDLIFYYTCADVFAMTSMLETFGIVLIEAMAAGLPIVCFDVPGIRDIVPKTIETVCAPGDTKHFIDVVYKLLTDTEQKQMPNQSYSQISKICLDASRQYDWAFVSQKYIELYANLLTS